MRKIGLFFAAFFLAIVTSCAGDLHNWPEPVVNIDGENWILFKTENEGPYYIWAWDNNGNGGEFFLNAAGWPGDELSLVSSEDGTYTYKYCFTKQDILPETLIISHSGGDIKDIDSFEFKNHGVYTAGSTEIVVQD